MPLCCCRKTYVSTVGYPLTNPADKNSPLATSFSIPDSFQQVSGVKLHCHPVETSNQRPKYPSLSTQIKPQIEYIITRLFNSNTWLKYCDGSMTSVTWILIFIYQENRMKKMFCLAAAQCRQMQTIAGDKMQTVSHLWHEVLRVQSQSVRCPTLEHTVITII
jgi:hypothetical protein